MIGVASQAMKGRKELSNYSNVREVLVVPPAPLLFQGEVETFS